MRPLGTQVGSQNGPKLEKNPGKIGVRCRLPLGGEFCSILAPKGASKNLKNQAPAAAGAIFFIFLNFAFGVPLGGQLGPILDHFCDPKRAKIAPEWASKLRRKYHRFWDRFLVDFGGQLGTQDGPKTAQEAPRSAQNGPPEGSKMRLRLGSRFGAHFGAFWGRFWKHFRTFGVVFWGAF